MYDYTIVGSGLFGSIFAYEANKHGYKCQVIEKRSHIGGNCYTKSIDDINVHLYGAHIFRTNLDAVWKYVNQFCEFNNFINSPIALVDDQVFNLPFNMNTFARLWNISKPSQAEEIITRQRASIKGEPKNLEEQAISLVGTDVYLKFIKEYTEKQWGKACKDLPASIIRRIPVRMTFDNNYFNAKYQGIPIGGYTAIFEKLLENVDVKLNTDFFSCKGDIEKQSKKIIFTGCIDEYYDYVYGRLEYRSLDFKHVKYDVSNFQGVAVVNYPQLKYPYTRSIEHKHFEFGNQKSTIVSYEHPAPFVGNNEPFYPINDKKNNELYARYSDLAKNNPNIVFGGRLGGYQYLDMQDTIIASLKLVEKEFGDTYLY
jgi:UDP-galactopyranose mutase